jgi:hypothetical protein
VGSGLPGCCKRLANEEESMTNVDIRVVATRGKHDAKILEALAQGKTQKEAAEYAGCTPRTIRRRLEDPVFRLELDECRREVVRQTASSLAQAAVIAVATLEAQCADRDPWLRQKAATILLDFDAKRQEREIEERLCALEERLGLRMKERERA